MARKSKTDLALEAQRKAIVDEIGTLDRELSEIRHKQRRYDELAKLIRSWYLHEDAASSATVEGDEYQVILSACGLQTKIVNITEILRLLGKEKFLEIATVSLKALEGSGIGMTAISALTMKEQTGTRSLAIVKKP